MDLYLLTILFSWFFTSECKKQLYSICDSNMTRIDAAVRQLETNFVLLVVGDTAFKLDLSGEAKATITWSKKVADWSGRIEPPIDMITTYENTANYIGLVNCAIETEWTIDLTDNKYISSKKSVDCQQNTFEYLVGREGERFLRNTVFKMKNLSSEHEIKLTTDTTTEYWLRSNDSNEMNARAIKLVDAFDNEQEIVSTYAFTSLSPNPITAAFIAPDLNWYLFGGLYYCKVKLNRYTFELCQPLLVKDWISNCFGESESNAVNRDISIWLIVIVALIAIGIVAVVIVLLLIYKEASKKSSTRQSLNSVSTGTTLTS